MFRTKLKISHPIRRGKRPRYRWKEYQKHCTSARTVFKCVRFEVLTAGKTIIMFYLHNTGPGLRLRNVSLKKPLFDTPLNINYIVMRLNCYSLRKLHSVPALGAGQ